MKIITLFFGKFLATAFFLQQEESNEVAIDLQPLYEPDPVPFSFETIGWKVLLVLLLIGVLFVVIKQYKLYKKNAYRREALQQLNNFSIQKNENFETINNINILLKKVAIIAFGREEVATLTGNNWLLFLESKSKNTPFINFESVFKNAIYKNENTEEVKLNDLVIITKKWIKTHA